MSTVDVNPYKNDKQRDMLMRSNGICKIPNFPNDTVNQRVADGQSPVFHSGPPSLIPGQTAWGLGWRNWHWDKFVQEYRVFPVPLSFPDDPYSLLHYVPNTHIYMLREYYFILHISYTFQQSTKSLAGYMMCYTGTRGIFVM